MSPCGRLAARLAAPTRDRRPARLGIGACEKDGLDWEPDLVTSCFDAVPGREAEMMTTDKRLRVGAAIIWASVLLFGVPATILAWLNSRSHLPLVLAVVGAGGLAAIAATLEHRRRGSRARAGQQHDS
jgi:hypothetical protein